MRILMFLRTWAAVVLGCLPLLALLLVPQLMRSRAGSETSLMIGVLALFTLLAAAVVFAPRMSASAAPVDGVWEARTALGATRRVWRTRAVQAWLALGAFLVVYGVGQAVGYLVGTLVPYVHDNPAAVNDPAASRWIIAYPAYALQAVALYVCTTLAVAIYAARMRTLAIGLTPPAPGGAARRRGQPGSIGSPVRAWSALQNNSGPSN
ncbi:hypothetical protein [Microbacterium sp. B35-30]|uniref:hypothetical protein n=1 Tax=Microbacterium sp. B35-30 TaxID=1962642 RepID=UPI00195358AA|nr:hypothetical protein [Microbacterium sp. B35-30]KAF2420864.1 hypothetical protein B2K11_00575 [Microbacterium sp. B35-30]